MVQVVTAEEEVVCGGHGVTAGDKGRSHWLGARVWSLVPLKGGHVTEWLF